MQTERPTTLLDPVCGMTVGVAQAEIDGLLVEYDGRTFAFCRDDCRRAFLEEPATYIARAERGAAAAGRATRGAAGTTGALVIDEGMRRWYESCSCCLSEAYPEVKAALDAERAARGAGPVDLGICEVAEGTAPEP